MNTLIVAAIRCSLMFSLPAVTIAPSAYAISYEVNRSWTDGGSAALVGTVDVALGSYAIMNGGPSPFMDVNLILTLNGTPFFLDHADTSFISGIGQFLINATASFLIFNTANADGTNPADLQIFNLNNTARYVIGSDGDPHFETGDGPSDDVIASVSFPVVFGTAASSVPDQGSTFLLLTLGLLGLVTCRRYLLRGQP
jgi:hypothetical protein